MKYRECPLCGAALDPGEKCDCQDEERGRPAAAETTSKKELPSAVYQAWTKKSIRNLGNWQAPPPLGEGYSRNMIMKGATT